MKIEAALYASTSIFGENLYQWHSFVENFYIL
jgi:hypothetical protein